MVTRIKLWLARRRARRLNAIGAFISRTTIADGESRDEWAQAYDRIVAGSMVERAREFEGMGYE